MKALRIFSVTMSLLLVALAVVAPVETQAMLHEAGTYLHLSGSGSATLAATTLLPLNRLARGKNNIGGVVKLYLYGENDFVPNSDWPKESDVVAGVVTTPMPLVVGTVATVLTFDIGSCKYKSNRKGKLGYQNVGVDGECKFAGYSADQAAALDKTINTGGVAIAVLKDGTRVILGSVLEPLEFEDSTDSGAKGDDAKMIDFKFKGDGYAFHPPTLAAAVVLALPA